MTRYRPNHAADAELRRLAGYAPEMARHAEEIKTFAERLSPRGVAARPGYARRFRVVTRRGRVFMTNTDIAAHLVEWGSANNPPYAVIRRAVRAAGLRLDERPAHDL